MWADELTRRYLPDRPIVTNRGASRLLLSAEASLKLEAFAEANRLAEQSLSTFRQCGETCGQADAARLLSVVMIHQDRRKEADRLLKDELSIFQTSAAYTSKSAEARLLLALAEVNSDRRGQKKREEALKFVGQARTLAIEEADVGLEASSLSVMAKIFIKYKGDAKACNKEAHRLATQALQLYEQTEDLRGQAIASHHSGIAQGNLGEMTASLQYMADSMAHWRKAQDPIMEANAQIMVGQLLLKGGLVRQAATAAEQALALYHGTGVTGARELRAMQTAVRAQIASGEPWRAIWTAEDAIARYRERHDRTNEAQALLCLASGYTFSPSGRDQQEVPAKMQSKMKPPPKEAVEAMQLALQIARQLNDSTLEAQVMAHLSTIHVQRTEMEEAIFAAHDALSHREVKDVASKGTAFQSLTSAHLHNKDFADAERAARAQRDFSRKEGSWQGDANGLLSMAQVLLAEKKFEESADKAKEAQGLFAEHKDRRGEAKALLQVARARQTAAEYEKALHVAERAQDLFLRVNDLMGKSEALQVMAECRSKLLKKQQEQSTKQLRARSKGNAKAPLPWEDLSRAATVSKQAKEAAHDVGDVQAEAAALCVIAQIHVFNGRPQSEILETLEDAMALAVEAEDGRTEATALLLKAEIHLQAEELQEALNAARQAELLLGRMDDEAASAKVEEILNKLRGFEFRVDEAPVAPAHRSYGYDPHMALPLVSGPDPAVVKATIQEVTKKMVGKEDDLEADMPLMDLGINSTNAVIFRNKLTSEFKDLELPATLVFDYPTVRALQGLVVEQTTAAALANAPEPMWAANAAMAQMAMAAHRAVDAVAVRRKIQEVTKGMVGSDLDIDADMPLMDIGINSMNAVVFRNKLGSTFDGVELPSTLVFDYPNIRAMSDLLTQITE